MLSFLFFKITYLTLALLYSAKYETILEEKQLEVTKNFKLRQRCLLITYQ